MRPLAWEPWTAAGAAFVLAATMGLMREGGPAPTHPRRQPGRSAGIVMPHAGVATVVPWSAVWTVDADPFVPWQLREAARSAGPGRILLPPGRQADVRPEPPVPERLPAAAPGGGGLPEVRGCISRAGGGPTAHVRLPGAAGWSDLVPGARVAGWTLLAIEAGNAARFRTPAGREIVVLIAADR